MMMIVVVVVVVVVDDVNRLRWRRLDGDTATVVIVR